MSAQTKSKTEQNKAVTKEQTNSGVEASRKLFLASSFKDVAKLFADFTGEELKGKSVTFIPTASIPESVKFFVSSGRKALEELGLTVDELELTQATGEEIRNKLEKNDYIYITGGNTFFLLQELKKTGADKILLCVNKNAEIVYKNVLFDKCYYGNGDIEEVDEIINPKK